MRKKIEMSEQKINKEGAEKLFVSLFKKMKIENHTAIAEAKKMLSSFEIKDSSEYRFIQSTGWLKKVTHTRTGENAQMKQVDTSTIELKE